MEVEVGQQLVRQERVVQVEVVSAAQALVAAVVAVVQVAAVLHSPPLQHSLLMIVYISNFVFFQQQRVH